MAQIKILNIEDFKNDLLRHTGSMEFYRFSLFNRNNVLTEGAKFMADSLQCYWLMDEIAIAQIDPTGKLLHGGYNFQCWTLDVSEDQSAILSATDGNDKVIYSKKFPLVDIPYELSDCVKLWAMDNGIGGITILLPSEY